MAGFELQADGSGRSRHRGALKAPIFWSFQEECAAPDSGRKQGMVLWERGSGQGERGRQKAAPWCGHQGLRREATWEDTGQRGRRAQGPKAGGCRQGDSQERRSGAGSKGQTQVSGVLGPRPPGAACSCPVLTTQTRASGGGRRAGVLLLRGHVERPPGTRVPVSRDNVLTREILGSSGSRSTVSLQVSCFFGNMISPGPCCHPSQADSTIVTFEGR